VQTAPGGHHLEPRRAATKGGMFARDQHSQIQEDNGDAQTDAPTQEPVHTDGIVDNPIHE